MDLDKLKKIEPQIPKYLDAGPEPCLEDLVRFYYSYHDLPDQDELVNQYFKLLEGQYGQSIQKDS
jgi:hypothetical protein